MTEFQYFLNVYVVDTTEVKVVLWGNDPYKLCEAAEMLYPNEDGYRYSPFNTGLTITDNTFNLAIMQTVHV